MSDPDRAEEPALAPDANRPASVRASVPCGAATSANDGREAHRRLAAFLRGETEDRLFREPTGHPAVATGFCFCDGSVLEAAGFFARAALLGVAMKIPSSAIKVWVLRRLGARIGRGVYLSAGVWVDPTFPRLVTIEDGVFIGMGARILTHEFRISEFRAGKVVIRKGAFVGGLTVVACGVEIGEGATVAACSVADRDVPPGATLVASPARIVKRREEP